MKAILPYLKAVAGMIASGLAVLYTALDDEMVTGQEWVAVVIAALASAGIVWAVPNLPSSSGKHVNLSK